MIFQYRAIDLQTGDSWDVTSIPGEFTSYIDFIGTLEDLNDHWRGEMRFEEIRESALTYA